jgi:hypothetical protein
MPDFRRLRFVGVAGIASVLVLAACGGSSAHASSSATTPTTTASNGATNGGSGRGRLTGFINCMSSHGVTLPQRPRTGTRGTDTPPSTTAGGRAGGNGNGFGGFANRFRNPPPGVDPTKYQAALNACRSTLPTGGSRLNNSAFQAYRSCLSDHGVQLPAQGQTTGSTINRNDPKVQTAMKTCAPLLPQGFGRGTTTTTLPKA